MSKGRNRVEVPEAREAMDRFKMEVASEIGVPLREGYNGDLSSYQNGSVGGEMVRKMIKAKELCQGSVIIYIRILYTPDTMKVCVFSVA